MLIIDLETAIGIQSHLTAVFSEYCGKLNRYYYAQIQAIRNGKAGAGAGAKAKAKAGFLKNYDAFTLLGNTSSDLVRKCLLVSELEVRYLVFLVLLNSLLLGNRTTLLLLSALPAGTRRQASSMVGDHMRTPTVVEFVFVLFFAILTFCDWFG